MTQASILAGVPAHAAFLFLERVDRSSGTQALAPLAEQPLPAHLLVGLGPSLLGDAVPGMREMPALTGLGISIPSTPHELLVRVAGEDPGEVLHAERALLASLPGFRVVDRVQAFMYGESRDLTGYEDGTENPVGEAAEVAALLRGAGPGLDGSTVLAVQRWEHDLDAFNAMGGARQDAAIGRERESNEEMGDAPESAHVKRTAQESFTPEAFVVRRSMPWRDHRGAGLLFLAFGATLDPFEAQLRRMVGLDDGIVDGLFEFTRPVTGCTLWCPPVRDGRLDLSALG